MKTYFPWTRYWYRIEEGDDQESRKSEDFYDLDDDGFLADPENNRYGNKGQVHRLSTFRDTHCVILLGGPGTGKSNEIHKEFDSLIESENVAKVFFDLNRFSSADGIQREVFEHERLQEWEKSEKCILNIYFDSLDEGKLHLKMISNVLSSGIMRLKSIRNRLRIRIACRSADWPKNLDDHLYDFWSNKGAKGFARLALTPLSLKDIKSAAEVSNVDPNKFIEEVITKSLQPLAVFPLSLISLINDFRSTNALPATRGDLFERECLSLCAENNSSRQSSECIGSLLPQKRFEIASQVAVFSILCNRSNIDLSEKITSTISLRPSDLSRVVDSSEAASSTYLRETLGTALFTGVGDGTVSFSHRAHAEFLAARYLLSKAIDQNKAKQLLFHQAHSSRIVPQLAEVSAWACELDDSFFELVLERDPLILLRSSLLGKTDDQRRRLIDRLAIGFRDEEFHDSEWGLSRSYRKLNHQDIEEQLRSLLSTNPGLMESRFLINTAFNCRTSGLIPDLVKLALSKKIEQPTRAECCRAVALIGDRHSRIAIKQLAIESLDEDDDDEIKGYALRALWPSRLISAQELFDCLSPPKVRNLVGAYKTFLVTEITDSLECEEVIIALTWLCSQTTSDNPYEYLDTLRDQIVTKSTEHFEFEAVLEKLADYLSHAATKSPFKAYHSQISLQSLLPLDKRQKLFIQALDHLDDSENHVLNLIDSDMRVVTTYDFPWIVQMSATEQYKTLKTRLQYAARILYCVSDPGHEAALASATHMDESLLTVFGRHHPGYPGKDQSNFDENSVSMIDSDVLAIGLEAKDSKHREDSLIQSDIDSIPESIEDINKDEHATQPLIETDPSRSTEVEDLDSVNKSTLSLTDPHFDVDRTSISVDTRDRLNHILEQWEGMDQATWDEEWKELCHSQALFDLTMKSVANRHLRLPELTETSIADLYISIATRFKHTEDYVNNEVSVSSERERVQIFRNNVLSILIHKGTLNSMNEIERIRAAFPNLKFMKRAYIDAMDSTIRATYSSLSPADLEKLILSNKTRIVRSDQELLDLVLESLKVLELRFTDETSASRDLWDRMPDDPSRIFRPVNENEFSDYIKRHLEIDLNQYGIIPFRETEVMKLGSVSTGRTDLYVVATLNRTATHNSESFRLIIEVKGSWHPELFTAMQSQLRDQYLRKQKCNFGIFLVGWFESNAWDPKDHRRRISQKTNFIELNDTLCEQSRRLSDGTLKIQSHVIRIPI